MKEEFEFLINQAKQEDELILKKLHKYAQEEKKHKKRLRKKYMLIPLIIFIILELLFILKYNFPNVILYTVMVFWLISAYIAIETLNINNYIRYNRKIKDVVISKFINNFFDDVDYVPNKRLPESIYREAQINNYSIYNSDDYIEAKINNKYSVQMANVLTEIERTDRDGGTTRTTTFSGLFAKVFLNRNINNSIFISNYKFDSKKRKKVILDSFEFEKKFSVFAQESIEAVQLLTSDVMQLLQRFSDFLNDKFDVSIINDSIYIRVYNHVTLESKVDKKEIIDEKEMEKYYKTFNFIYNLSLFVIKWVDESYIDE